MNVVNIGTFLRSEFEPIRHAAEPVFRRLRRRNENGRRLRVTTITSTLAAALKDARIDVKAMTLPSADAAFSNYPSMGGWTYCRSERNSIPRIEIELAFEADCKQVLWSPIQWQHLQFRFYATIQHELVHRYQFLKRYRGPNNVEMMPMVYKPCEFVHKKQAKDQRYLGEYDEIEAYALDIVNEWWYYIGTTFTMQDLKRNFKSNADFRTPSMNYYSCVFNCDDQHLAIRTLFRKIKEWNAIVVPLAGSLPSCPTSVVTSLKLVPPV